MSSAAILVINAGSMSAKFAAYPVEPASSGSLICQGQVEAMYVLGRFNVAVQRRGASRKTVSKGVAHG